MRVGMTLMASALVLFYSSAPVFAAESHQHNHNHGGAAQAAPTAPCSDALALPSLDCAETHSVTFDTEGRLWLVWAASGHVYVQHSSEPGKDFSPAVAVNRVPEKISAKNENRPKIVVDRQGRVFVSWTTPLEKRFTGNIRFSRSVDGGGHFSDPVTVNDNRDITGHRFDAMAVNQQGDVYITWIDKRHRLEAERAGQSYSGAAIYYALSDDGGESFHPNKKVIDHSCECCRIAIDMDRDQLPVVMWRNIYGDNIRDHALVKFVAKDQPGKPLRATFDEWQIDACPHHGPAISVAGEGVYHMAWFDNAPQRHGLFYGRAEQGGRVLSQPVAVGNYNESASHPDVLGIGNQVHLVWKEFNGEVSSIRYMRSADGGRHWGEVSSVAETRGESDYPFLVHQGERVYLSWLTKEEGYRLLPLFGGNSDAQ